MKARVAMALVCGLVLTAWPAGAETGFASVSVNLRAGPGTGYPVVRVIPGGARLNIVGCLANYAWCDVVWGIHRGWVYGRYLQDRRTWRSTPLNRGPFGTTAFDFNSYWADHYRDRSFYRHRDRWNRLGPAGHGTGLPDSSFSRPDRGRSNFERPCQPGTAGCRQGRFD